ncbi:hypothetical protein SAMN05216178_6297 [Pseudomonas saponiphila]|uniref:Uncharacterized protein n=1 Tax=Pseudomonas saponiphila TaxID=556534 RepID=A0A1H4Y154_9PSED|nr:hypothetical protein [Pseudomonas saponiphila]SED11623.1 hypothetical protein SAMN05216178_6297 [Pseudomonas saponiphila]
MKTNYFNAFTTTGDTLALIPIYLGSPGAVSGPTLIGKPQGLGLLPSSAIELAEVFHRVNSIIQPGQTAFVTPTKTPETPFGAVIADARGRICATGRAADARSLADLIRHKLQPAVGAGEASP